MFRSPLIVRLIRRLLDYGVATALAIRGGGVELFENIIQVLWVQYMMTWNKAVFAYLIALFLHWIGSTFENLA